MAIQALNLLASIFEPHMPSFSAKVYEQLALKRTAEHEVLYKTIKANPQTILTLIKGGHVCGDPKPIFREIKEEEAEMWKQQFSGVKA
jgi:methionyl-tRNA synthetase